MSEEKKRVIPMQALILVLVAVSIIIFGIKVVAAPTAIILLFDGVVIITLSALFGIKYSDMQADIVKCISSMMIPILIVLSVGMLVGAWMLSGTVPIMIYYGMKIISPSIFLAAACIVCTLMSVMAGTSWGTISTVGVAFMGISAGLNIPLEYTAGAIVVGAIFGDKLSPLSDSTVLAAAVSDIEIFDGVKHTLKSTGPAYLISLIIFIILGMRFKEGFVGGEDYDLIISTLNTNFNLNPILLLPPILVFGLILMKKPTLPVFTVGILAGSILALIFQGVSVTDVALALNKGYTNSCGIEVVDKMLQRGGLSSMLSTVALLIASGVFGAPLRTAGVIDIMMDKITDVAKSPKSMATGILGLHGIFFVITGSYYVTYSVIGPMVKDLFTRYGLSRKNLARILLDTGTGLAPIIPWSVTGVFIANTLGVPTMKFFLYAPMTWLSIVFSLVYILTGFTMVKAETNELEEAV
ncbi:MAG: Na+/H+ antiporter NhaC family protein [Anaerovorax sp.]|nr:Na+/H+ antiporter NhaC family protein [Anaerovorax sp.]